MENTYLVMDIETVPDLSVWKPKAAEIPKIQIDAKPSKASIEFAELVVSLLHAESPVHPDDIEKAHDICRRAELKDNLAYLDTKYTPKPPESEFAPIYAQAPVAIGCVWLANDLTLKKIGCLRVAKDKPLLEAEAQMLQEWNTFMMKERPTIITWNGRAFDMPALMMRCIRHGINLSWYFSEKDYRYRYSEEKHCDLMDAMADYGATRNLKLDAVANLIGLPGKHNDMDGSKVAGMFADGKIDEIADYCTSDTVQTALVYLRWRLVKGRMTLEKYQESITGILNAMSLRPETQTLLSLIDQKRLLLTQA
jgi:hypothetical protein